ncbi:tyrosine-type recombinase/integrase [Pinibacter soli]|uniref:Tyrosine-type recombinase/integrase n=1 Tax=Pinibacter soli TaxID=3044211 RepID=A0ABT6R9U8_9BACT|nr:tyrosine-type recombinase/integrase [Pinibacter soli]MDI3319273.1 tyrosine-type recombinase/integrase [Pinibacter soli]
MMADFGFEIIKHKGENRIRLNFPHITKANNKIRAIAGARWSSSLKCWHIPDTPENRRNFCGKDFNVPIGKTLADVNQKKSQSYCSPENQAELQKYVTHLRLKAYSVSTIRTYQNEFRQLLQTIGNYRVTRLLPDDLRRYMLYCIDKEKLTENTIHSRINALKFYFEQVLHQEKMFLEIPRPKKPISLPHYFNQAEITAIIKAAGNLKHRVMLMLAYSAGMRVSEVVAIRTRNIDSNRMCILVEQAKGKKDRLVALSPVILVMLREYWKAFKPSTDGYLFDGQQKGQPYSSRSLQLVLQSAKQKAGILKPGSVHALRHSFATHLLDKGTDVTMIMKLLGHNDLKTTLRYLHVTNRDLLHVVSPLDDLKLD